MNECNRRFSCFHEFYPFYLSEHRNRTSRRLHFLGTALVILLMLYIMQSGDYRLVPLLFIAGYGFAWTGHFWFEKNKPATFCNPFYSLAGDFVMFRDMLMGRIPF